MVDENQSTNNQTVATPEAPDGFGWDLVVALSEGGMIGTLSAVAIGALSNLPVVIIGATYAVPVGLVVGVMTAAKLVRSAYKNRK